MRANFKDLLGQVFGSLTVIKRAGNAESGNAKWECLCRCGGSIVCISNNLLSGKATACKACHHEAAKNRAKGNSYVRKPKGENALNTLIYNYKRHAESRSLGWNLTREEFKAITKKECEYCGVEPKQVILPKNAHGSYIYNGIDRVNNLLGYTPSNTVPCCKICNVMKLTMGQADFIAHIHKISAKHKKHDGP